MTAPTFSQKVVALGRERVDQQALLQCDHPMDEIGRDYEAASLFQARRHAVNGDIECAFGNVADLCMRMGMWGTDGAFLETESDKHHLRAMAYDRAAIAGGDFGPDGIFRPGLVRHEISHRASQPPSTGRMAP